MPNKHNQSRRHKFKKAKYKVTNWKEYNAGLVNRGNVTIWFTDDAIAAWEESLDNYGGKGRPRVYSEVAIRTALMLRQVFSLPLRQTEGFMKSLCQLMGLTIPVMDYSTLSKRSDNLTFIELAKEVKSGSHIIVDSTGLKVYGQDEWHQEKHNVTPRRTWRKLHLGVDEHHHIVAVDLTLNDVGDTTALPDLLAQGGEDVETFLGDGAYDGEPSYTAILERYPGADIIIPPPKNAVKNGVNVQRDTHIESIAQHGRIGWQKQTGYGLRSYAELAMLRYKTIIGPCLKARKLTRQQAEAKASVRVLNRMTQCGMPLSIRIA